MLPNILRVHSEYGLVKSVGPKVLWAVAAETTDLGGWGMFPSPPVPFQNCGGEDRWRRYLSCVEVQPVSGSGNFHSFPSGRTRQQQQ
ncbi:hypothetical protein TNCV_4934071 [Trichonephila clavipes]|nr:hypothetical protein TNCV_4934071 [Trichonephila clavipes]